MLPLYQPRHTLLVTSLHCQAAIAAATSRILDLEFSTADLKAEKYFTRLITGNVATIVSLERTTTAERQSDTSPGDDYGGVYVDQCGSGGSESWTIEIEGVLTVQSNGSGAATQSVVYTASSKFTIVDSDFECIYNSDMDENASGRHIDDGCDKMQSSFDEFTISYGDGGDVLTDVEKIMLEKVTADGEGGDFTVWTLSPLVERLYAAVAPMYYASTIDWRDVPKRSIFEQMGYAIAEHCMYDVEEGSCALIVQQSRESCLSHAQLADAGVTSTGLGKNQLRSITTAISGAVPTPTTTAALQALVDTAVEAAAVAAVAAAVGTEGGVFPDALADAGIITNTDITGKQLNAIDAEIRKARIDAGHTPTTTAELQVLVDKGIAAATAKALAVVVAAATTAKGERDFTQRLLIDAGVPNTGMILSRDQLRAIQAAIAAADPTPGTAGDLQMLVDAGVAKAEEAELEAAASMRNMMEMVECGKAQITFKVSKCPRSSNNGYYCFEMHDPTKNGKLKFKSSGHTELFWDLPSSKWCLAGGYRAGASNEAYEYASLNNAEWSNGTRVAVHEYSLSTDGAARAAAAAAVTAKDGLQPEGGGGSSGGGGAAGAGQQQQQQQQQQGYPQKKKEPTFMHGRCAEFWSSSRGQFYYDDGNGNNQGKNQFLRPGK